MTIDFKAEAEALRDEMIARRRDLHQHPEIAFEEVRTAGIVAEELNNLGLEVQTGIGKTGVVGIMEGDSDGPTVLIRADMDALPVHEENSTDYISLTAGKMHACGHDGHTTIGLSVAKILSGHRDKMHGRVKFVFQPAEEIAGGALAMIKDGVLGSPRPDVSLGLHLWNYLPVGKLGVASGPVMAGSNSFTITIRGKGSHGAIPQEALDPIVCAAQIITAMQTITSRNMDPLEGAVVSATQIHAGHANNVIPMEAKIGGTIRSFKPDVKQLLETRLVEIVENIAKAMGCTATVDFLEGTKPVTNDAEVAMQVRDAFTDIVSEDAFVLDERAMVAEDMTYLMDDIPGMFFFVGSANAERDLNYGHHHPRFDFDEDALPLATALMARAAASYVLIDEI
ncbi:MAG: amidohydrolase [Chloroflexota bacterium]